MTTENLTELLELAKKDQKILQALKNGAVKCQKFQLAADLRDIEKELFPENPASIEAKKLAKEVKEFLNTFDLGVNDSQAWLLYEAFLLFIKKKGKVSEKNTADLIAKQESYFS